MFPFWSHTNLCRTLRTGGRFEIPKKQVPEDVSASIGKRRILSIRFSWESTWPHWGR